MTPQKEWDRCRHHIVAALAHGPGAESIEDVERLIERGCYLVFFGDDSCLIGAVTEYPQRKLMRMIHAGGDMEELMSKLPQLEEWAATHGCDGMLCEGRLGWKRVLEKRGYRVAWLCMIKDLHQ